MRICWIGSRETNLKIDSLFQIWYYIYLQKSNSRWKRYNYFKKSLRIHDLQIGDLFPPKLVRGCYQYCFNNLKMNIPYSNPSNKAWMPASLRGLVNFEANLMPDSESAQKTWLYMETMYNVHCYQLLDLKLRLLEMFQVLWTVHHFVSHVF